MPRASTPQAAAAALGMLAGFALTPAERSPLEREFTPHAVAVVWDAPTPAELPAAGVRADGRGDRLSRAPGAKLAPMRARAPEGRAASPSRQKANPAPHPFRQRDLVTFPEPQPVCGRHAEHSVLTRAS